MVNLNDATAGMKASNSAIDKANAKPAFWKRLAVKAGAMLVGIEDLAARGAILGLVPLEFQPIVLRIEQGLIVMETHALAGETITVPHDMVAGAGQDLAAIAGPALAASLAPHVGADIAAASARVVTAAITAATGN